MIIKYRVKSDSDVTNSKFEKIDIWIDKEISIPDELIDKLIDKLIGELWSRIGRLEKETGE